MFILAVVVLSACVTAVEKQRPHVEPRPQMSVIPLVEDMPLDRARVELEHAGYRLGYVTHERDRYAPPRTVLWQEPKPYTRAPVGSEVDLVVSARARPYPAPPPDLTSVPELRGLGLKKVRRALRRADLRLGEVTERFADNAEPGTVIRQRPSAPRRIEPGSAVDIVIARAEDSRPVAGAKVPKLRGLSLKKARAELTTSPLRLGHVTERAEADARMGTVIGQQPAPRTRVRSGSTVDLVIAGEKPAQPVARAKVPKLHGLPLKKARARLKQAQLRLGEVTEKPDQDARNGTVIGQEPAPKRRVKPGMTVDVVIASTNENQQPNTVKVPNLLGQKVFIVVATLERLDLKLGRIRKEKREQGSRNTVLMQTPKPGAMVRPGTTVDLVVLNTRDE
jgi:beta-lactam-binding protein with PASTA domain